ATEEELLLDTYIRYLQVINDLKKCGYPRIIKKTIVVTSDPLALFAEKTKLSKSKEKVVVSSDFEGSEVDDFSKLKKITALLKQEFVKTGDKKEDKEADEKKRDMSRVKCYNCKKEEHFAKDCKKAKKVLLDSEASSSSADEKISEVSYYLSESKSESEYETSEYYKNTTNYGLFVNDNDDQEIFHECENIPE
nr:hypothetical protein [Tanacetum cinerariifolium]